MRVPSTWRAFTLLELIIVIAVIAIVLAIAVPNLIAARKHSQENAAVGNLKTVIAAQTLFKEQDKETDLNFDYGRLLELSAANVVDPVLGSGTRGGYLYQIEYGVASSEFIWFGVANPIIPGSTGDLYFCVNQRGVIFYTFEQSISMNNTDCNIPSFAIPVYSR